MIQISFDEHNLPAQEVLRATSRYFAELAGDTQNVEIKESSLSNTQLASVRSMASHLPKHPTVADTGHVTQEELADADMGKDADRPNDVPSTADVESPPTAPEDVFGHANVPQPPAVPSVPVAPVPTDNVTPTNPADADSRGFPWDERIHSSSKAKNADGTWRQRRGVSGVLVAEIERELVQGGVTAPNDVPLPPTGDAFAIKSTEQVYNDMAAAAPLVPLPPPVDVAPTTFPQLVQWVMGHISAKRLTQHEVNEVVKELGLPGVPAVAANPAMIPQVHAKIVELLNMVKE
jgi:hypothetical protein